MPCLPGRDETEGIRVDGILECLDGTASSHPQNRRKPTANPLLKYGMGKSGVYRLPSANLA